MVTFPLRLFDLPFFARCGDAERSFHAESSVPLYLRAWAILLDKRVELVSEKRISGVASRRYHTLLVPDCVKGIRAPSTFPRGIHMGSHPWTNLVVDARVELDSEKLISGVASTSSNNRG